MLLHNRVTIMVFAILGRVFLSVLLPLRIAHQPENQELHARKLMTIFVSVGLTLTVQEVHVISQRVRARAPQPPLPNNARTHISTATVLVVISRTMCIGTAVQAIGQTLNSLIPHVVIFVQSQPPLPNNVRINIYTTSALLVISQSLFIGTLAQESFRPALNSLIPPVVRFARSQPLLLPPPPVPSMYRPVVFKSVGLPLGQSTVIHLGLRHGGLGLTYPLALRSQATLQV